MVLRPGHCSLGVLELEFCPTLPGKKAFVLENKAIADFHLYRIIGGVVGTLKVLAARESRGGETHWTMYLSAILRRYVEKDYVLVTF